MFQIDLVERCKANDRKAQLKLYKQYCDAMYYIAFGFLKNCDDAEDVVQESFIKAFQRIEQYSGEVTFGAWLKRIVINRSLDFLKHRKLERVEMNESHLKIIENDDWSIADSITVQEVKLKMDKLPEKYKYVVRLFLVEGYDHSEISEILNLSESACRTRLLRGKGYLRALLKN
ncbi:sigma-70 family RNA polymerase sigma factor [Kriegella sp. EG-1]|nr:sigma-70 family RNA polymerase sigma factor [Flavobacteriaceae bacterium EG-1]